MAKDKRKYTPPCKAARALATLDPLHKVMDDPNFAALCKQHEDRQKLAEKLSRGLLRTFGRQPNAVAPRSAPARSKASPQQKRVRGALLKLYPPNGVVPVQVPIKAVWQKVVEELKDEGKKHSLAAPSWETVARVLGRGRKA